MHWNGLNDFLSMGGYGFYVWVSFGATLLCIGMELIFLKRRSRVISSEMDL